MPIGGNNFLQPGDAGTRNTILQWSFNRSNNASADRCLYDIDEGAEIVLLVTWLIPNDQLDPNLPPPENADISAAYLSVILGVDTGRGGTTHREFDVDLARGFQLSAPCLSVTVFGRYPVVPDVYQPVIKVNASVGRGGHGCGCPTRTLVAPIVGGPAPILEIPVLAYSAVLLAPAPAPGARLLQYTLGGALLSDSPITPETGVEAKITPGAVYFAISNAPVGSRVSFKLAA